MNLPRRRVPNRLKPAFKEEVRQMVEKSKKLRSLRKQYAQALRQIYRKAAAVVVEEDARAVRAEMLEKFRQDGCVKIVSGTSRWSIKEKGELL